LIDTPEVVGDVRVSDEFVLELEDDGVVVGLAEAFE
jgi:hypothetical protein